MFEKEAEEYAEKTKTEKEIEVLNTVHDWGQESLSPSERRLFEDIQDRERAREQGFKDGAKFGYEKGKNEAVKHLKDLVYVVELGKNELATARIVAEAKKFLKEIE